MHVYYYKPGYMHCVGGLAFGSSGVRGSADLEEMSTSWCNIFETVQ